MGLESIETFAESDGCEFSFCSILLYKLYINYFIMSVEIYVISITADFKL